MKKYLFTLFIAITLFSAQRIFGQTSDSSISITADPRIEELAERYNKTHEIRGYRIQIISSSRKEEARKVKSKFASRYTEIQAHEVYQQPFFIIKVGDFQTKLEAEKFHRQIEEEYPGSYVTPDIIQPFNQYTKSD